MSANSTCVQTYAPHFCEWLENNPYSIKSDGRLPDCPLVELPSKHGRLVDCDALMEKESAQYENAIKGKECDWFDKILADLIHEALETTLTEKNTPTVLEPEE